MRSTDTEELKRAISGLELASEIYERDFRCALTG